MTVVPQAGFGASFLLSDGDLVFTAAGVEPVQGLSNLTQALTLRLLTPYGTDRVNATYGLDAREAFSGNHDRTILKELIRLEVLRTLSGDPRVREVTGVLFDDDPDFPAAAAAATQEDHGGRLWRVLVTVETTDDTAAVVLADVER
ncbi:hypothetical protein COUCH_15775 [Couchioplanes caeruleus]|uniref:hypothetical protein n=1 Tax=Couchioplanes caeruleus TaxID=56438 RepID=UPI0020BFF622|nr:hypothetical protein [Couchioplanes caeruleus]UQU67639.1 hypothetical protein COUCH_15775 [Couchioplanes caeruleus]